MAGKLNKQISSEELKKILIDSNYVIRKAAEIVSEKLQQEVTPQLIRYWTRDFEFPVHNKPEPKILIFDIETAPMKVYTWGLWDQTIPLSAIVKDWYVLCWSAKWLNTNKIHNDGLIKHTGYNSEDDCEFNVIESAWNILDQADIVVAHNGKSFDKKKMNAKFLQYGFPEPTYKLVDPRLIAKGNFALTSNKLDYISRFFGNEGKLKTDFDLWKGCMDGDKKSWNKMMKYCDQDIKELEQVYLALRSWDKNHPSYGMYTENDKVQCNVCGSTTLSYDKDTHTATSTFEVYMCEDCGHKQRGRKSLTSKNKEKQVNQR